jgi:formamidopyrimidine-DNA glycosylase
MPELPEVETVVCALRPHIVGRKIEDLFLKRRDLRFPFPRGFQKNMRGLTIQSISRRAKYILIHLSNGQIWITHLGMTGMFYWRALNAAPVLHDHVVIDLDNQTRFVYNDPRRFGYMDVVAADKIKSHKFFIKMGLEPFDKAFHAAYLFERLLKKKAPIKTSIMDQGLVVGVGNIYASESLFDAKIDPRRAASDLTIDECRILVLSIQKILKKAIAAGGSSIQHFETPAGGSGYFQHEFTVYDRAGEACSCAGKKAVIEKITQQGRSTYFCATCQR